MTKHTVAVLLLMLTLCPALFAQGRFASDHNYTDSGITIWLGDQYTRPATYFCLRADDESVSAFEVKFEFTTNLTLYRTSLVVQNAPKGVYPRLACAELSGTKTASIHAIEVKPLKGSDPVKF